MADTLKFKIEEQWDDTANRSVEIAKIYINDVELLSIVKDYEAGIISSEEKSIVGKYVYLDPLTLYDFLCSYNDVETISAYDGIPVLCCECRTIGCWDLTIMIEESADSITWRNFQQPHRTDKWDYSRFNTFKFEKETYWETVKRLLLPNPTDITLPASQNMTFRMSTRDCECDITNWIIIENEIWSIEPHPDSFVVLEPSKSIQSSIYLQAALPIAGHDDGLGFIVETRLVYTDSFIHYQLRAENIFKVLRLFRAYFEGLGLPDLSDWDNITEQFTNEDMSDKNNPHPQKIL